MTRVLICIGASTGGVDALENVLAHFPADCPPTCIVQHILGGFSGGLARRLDRACAARVVEAEHDMRLDPGTVAIAPGNAAHLLVRRPGTICVIRPDSQVSGHRPSVDVLFRSAAESGAQVVAALLTGMGRDGADGLHRIRAAGGRTIAQDEATSIVYGMPRVAAEIGAAEFVLPLPQIGPKLVRLAAQVCKGASA